MTITAKIICDSISEPPYNIRLTTIQLRFPRFLLAEFNTHRAFSRNASSSRAIPTNKIINDIFYPVIWAKNIPGMQASDELLEGNDLQEAKEIWEEMIAICSKGTKRLAELGLHKQWANRPTEWFGYVNVLVSATNWDNFFKLRDHKDAQPEIMILAQAIKKAMAESIPKVLREGEWHLPYINEEDLNTTLTPIGLTKCSVARCARVSYLTFEGKKPIIENDLKLYDKLVGSEPLHASPAEHVATPDKTWSEHYMQPFGSMDGFRNVHLHGNFWGWQQYRRMLEFDRELNNE